MLDVAVIIVSWNVRNYLRACLTSVHEELMRSGLRGEIWVVDNGSTDGTIALLTELFPQVHLIRNEANVGFGAANNQGMAAALAADDALRYFWLLNPDTVVRPGALAHLVDCLENCPQAGLVGPRLAYGDGRLQHSAFAFPGLVQLALDLWPAPARLYESGLNGRYSRRAYNDDHEPFVVDFVLGASMLVRRDVAVATGGFDEAFHMYCEEIDWCWRIREAGWKIFSVPAASVVHFGGESTRQVPANSILNLWRSRAQLYLKHHRRLTFLFASYLAQFGLRRKANQAADGELRQAYADAAALWRESRHNPDNLPPQSI
jgi:GT2 family glycosyltransferase